MEEIELSEIFNTIWNKRYHIIAIVFVFMAIGFLYETQILKPMYSSSTTLVLVSSQNKEKDNKTNTMTATDVTMNSNLVSTYSKLLKSNTVLEKVIDNLYIQIDIKDLQKNITVNSIKNTELIEVTVRNENPYSSAKIANELTKVFTEQVQQLYNINNVQMVSEAQVPSAPSNMNYIKDMVIFVLVGIVVAIAYVLISNMFDTTIKSADEIESNFKIPVIASIPLMDNLKSEKGGKK